MCKHAKLLLFETEVVIFPYIDIFLLTRERITLLGDFDDSLKSTSWLNDAKPYVGGYLRRVLFR